MTPPDHITVAAADGRVDQWAIEHSTLGRDHRLVLRSPTNDQWTSQARDVFECLMGLREQVEPLGLRLCCNGARRDAWASGMQRDMGSGFTTYLLGDTPKGQRPPAVATLDTAPIELVVTADEQRSWYRAWLGVPPT